jgi:hypothetical protein
MLISLKFNNKGSLIALAQIIFKSCFYQNIKYQPRYQAQVTFISDAGLKGNWSMEMPQ